MKLGSRIRELRLEKKKTIKEVAQETDLTSSFISQVENGKVEPSLRSLAKIATALHVPVMLFFLPAYADSIITHQEKRNKIILPDSETVYEVLSPLTDKIEFLLAEIESGKQGDLEMVPHEGEEHIYVVKGKVEITLGDQVYTLEKGDSISFQSMIPHKIGKNLGKEKVILVIAQSPPSF